MSDQLSAAADAMGIPEALVERSAEARAAEAGTSAEEIIAAWAGGGAMPESAEPDTAAEPAEPEAVDEAAADEAEETEEAEEGDRAEPAPEIVLEEPTAAPEPSPAPEAPAGPYRPPVLVGAKDNPMMVLTAAIGLFVVIFLVGFIGPSVQGDTPGAMSSEIDYSTQAVEGRDTYRTLNCGACHTQMVRPVIADVGLGGVTVHDSNQVLGTRRFGPDLSDIGSRVTRSQLAAIVGGLGEHPGYSLSNEDLEALVSYLAESQTSGGS